MSLKIKWNKKTGLLDIRFNNLSNLSCINFDDYPNIKILYCSFNQLTYIDYLPISLKILDCSNNRLTKLDKLPINLKELYCWNNQLTALDNLPINLKELYCIDNPLDAKYKNMSSNDIIKLNKNMRKKEQYAEYINNEQLKAKIYLKYIALNFNELIPLDILNEIINFIV
jgi:Leucine-rich repeat (LRR) protein